jgi:alcohol dehydrogenase class IV
MLAVMVPFSLETPRAIHFGVGALQKLAVLASGVLPARARILLVTGRRWLADSPIASAVREALGRFVLETYPCPAGEPSTASLEAACRVAALFRPDAIVAVGGGSVMDTAKALSALARYPGPVERFLEGVEGATEVPGPCLPWIAVPTTAGTGAEVTKNSVVRSEALGVKRSMRSSHLLAAAVIVDPALTLSLPPEVTGTSGLDALTQLTEAFVTRIPNPLVNAMVEGAFAPMLDALGGLARFPADVDLRAKASYGALVSGIALANAGLGAAHGFAGAVGGAFDVPHGLACAVFLPLVLEANAPVIRPGLARLAATHPGFPRDADPVSWLAAEVRGLLAAYGLPSDLRGRGIPLARIPELAEKASGSSMRGNPRELPRQERLDILSRVIG